MGEHKRKEMLMKGPHPLDGLRALGEWIIVEQKGARETTSGGLHIPEVAQEMLWFAIGVGEKVEKVKVGDALLFVSPESGPFQVDGRTFAAMKETSIAAVLRTPSPEDRKLVQLVGAVS